MRPRSLRTSISASRPGNRPGGERGGRWLGAKTDFATGIAPFSVAVGDFNGDGRPDLATANYTGDTVSILLGNANGTFSATTDVPTGAAVHRL